MEEAFLIKTLMGIIIAAVTTMGKRLWDMSQELGHKASYEWVEKTLKPDIVKDIDDLRDDVDEKIDAININCTMKTGIVESKHNEIINMIKEIKDYIVGSIDKPGLRSIVSDIEKRIEHLEDRIK